MPAGGKNQVVRLRHDEALTRLRDSVHGVFSTVHPVRGVDTIPVVFAIDESWRVVIPIDLVKPKAMGRLQRERNLDADPRAMLLVDRWDPDDWSKLWWVRAELRYEATLGPRQWGGLATQLSARYVQYADEPFARLLVLRIVGVTGWAGRDV